MSQTIDLEFWNKAIKVFDTDEGVKLSPYKDTKGYWTIGRGHLIGPSLIDLKLSKKVVDLLFQEDLDICISEAREVLGLQLFESLNEARKLAVISLFFTLGKHKVLLFKETLAAIRAQDWRTVSERLLKTKWASDVDPTRRTDWGRDDRIAYMFRTGKFHPDYKIGEV